MTEFSHPIFLASYTSAEFSLFSGCLSNSRRTNLTRALKPWLQLTNMISVNIDVSESSVSNLRRLNSSPFLGPDRIYLEKY